MNLPFSRLRLWTRQTGSSIIVAMNKTIKKNPAPSAARERIIATAHDLFYTEGVRATGVDKVIADADVTKSTFYRHFPSKNDLVEASLSYCNQRWMEWFNGALEQYRADGPKAVVSAMREWFEQPNFRGCAFINTLVELGGSVPVFAEISRQHKQQVAESIRALLLGCYGVYANADADASAIALAVDGATIHAQYTHNAEEALTPLSRLIDALLPPV